MSASADVTIWCDAPGCNEWAQSDSGDGIAATRAALKRRGWRRKAGLDLCRECVEAAAS